ncbi:hypothetical protein [Nocardia panacis]|uniref:hypothetical protein n=1 Tax=Nocardia panacis TaxID=2340916 RepID=UPI0011C42BF9|nr:hypothetical protein [Nocardia panacis]
MSDSTVDAIESILEAITDAVSDPTPRGQGRLLVLARTLSTLANLAAALELTDQPKLAPAADGPAVIAAHPDFPASWLKECRNGTVLRSELLETIWHKVDGWWYTTGSEVALDSLDVAAQGPFAVLTEPM